MPLRSSMKVIKPYRWGAFSLMGFSCCIMTWEETTSCTPPTSPSLRASRAPPVADQRLANRALVSRKTLIFFAILLPCLPEGKKH